MDAEVIELKASCPRDVALRTPTAKRIQRSKTPGHWLVTLHTLVENKTQALEVPLAQVQCHDELVIQCPPGLPSEVLFEVTSAMQDSLVTTPFKITDYIEISAS
jgi:hypothetical protein